MYSNKTLLAAASLAVLSAAGIGAADAAPWAHHDRAVMHRSTVERERIADTLRLRHYRMVGDPYFVRGHYVVRSHDRFGRMVFVQIDPYSGAYLGEIRL